ncbi:MAG: hypothetical protein EPO21_10685 [Chloroflexota bacterium]|nr:MAG: hypothetical protein EPO21_10685 [Chloroflexota bacterium]
MDEKQHFTWLILALLLALLALDLVPFVEAVGEANLAALGWAALLIAIVTYGWMVGHLSHPPGKKVLDLLLILLGAGVYALLQTSLMVFVFQGFQESLIWLLSLMLILAVIGVTLYRYR